VLSFTKRILILMLFGVVALGVYKGTQYIVLNYVGVSTIDLRLPGEEQIPFLPLIILLYMVAYIMTSWVILKFSLLYPYACRVCLAARYEDWVRFFTSVGRFIVYHGRAHQFISFHACLVCLFELVHCPALLA